MKTAISYIIMLILIGALVGVCLFTAGCDEEYPAPVKARADANPVVIRARAEAAKIEAEAKRIKVHIDDSDGYSVQEYEQIKRRHWASFMAGLIVMTLVAVGLVAMSGAAALSIAVFRFVSRITYVKAFNEKGGGKVRPEGSGDGFPWEAEGLEPDDFRDRRWRDGPGPHG